MKSFNILEPDDVYNHLLKQKKMFSEEDLKEVLAFTDNLGDLPVSTKENIAKYIKDFQHSLVVFGYLIAHEDVANISTEVAQRMYNNVHEIK